MTLTMILRVPESFSAITAVTLFRILMLRSGVLLRPTPMSPVTMCTPGSLSAIQKGIVEKLEFDEDRIDVVTDKVFD